MHVEKYGEILKIYIVLCQTQKQTYKIGWSPVFYNELSQAEIKDNNSTDMMFPSSSQSSQNAQA